MATVNLRTQSPISMCSVPYDNEPFNLHLKVLVPLPWVWCVAQQNRKIRLAGSLLQAKICPKALIPLMRLRSLRLVYPLQVLRDGQSGNLIWNLIP